MDIAGYEISWALGFEERLDQLDERLIRYGIGFLRNDSFWTVTVVGGGSIWKVRLESEEIEDMGDDLVNYLQDDDEV